MTLEALVERARTLPAPLVLVDGTSGAGKTTLATRIVTAWPHPVALVHVDDVLQGWDDLEATAARLGRALVARAHGAAVVLPRWDWLRSRVAGRIVIDPRLPLVVEGCGAFALGADGVPAVRIRLDGDAAVRRARAIARDPYFADRWAAWERATAALAARQTRLPHLSATMEA